MKKTISLVLALITIFGAACSLASCSDSDVPYGMQLIRGGEELGYYFYGPEEWVVANSESEGIACSYVSKLNNTSVTLVEAKLPSVEINRYFAEELQKFPESFGVEVTLDLKESSFGNAEKAYKVSYTYTYGEYKYRALQIFALYESRFYIFTYTASMNEYSEDVTYYDNYLEKVESIIENVKFVSKVAGEEGDAPEYVKDSDGYSLISDKDVCGFDLYIPDGYSTDYATAIVSASREDGTNINVTEATGTNTDSVSYWQTRFDQLGVITDGEVTIIREDVDNITDAQVRVVLGDGINATSLEYTYSLLGTSYSVYQVLIVKGMRGYVFTFTAESDVYGALLPEAKTILYKMKF